jgi:alkylhydroperoxidase family enzyme
VTAAGALFATFEHEDMIRWLINKRLDSAERQLGESIDYARHILRVSLRAFLRYARFLSVAGYRRALPRNVMHVAQLVAVRDEDCGNCVQIGLNVARADGVPVDQLQAVLDQRPDALPPELADAYRFAEAVVTANGRDAEYRERIRARYGEEALVEFALAMASCRTFPVVKRALGYSTSCNATRFRL